MSIKIVLADDHKIFRQGIRSLLEKEKRITIVGETENGRDTVKLTRKLLPDIVVMDISMPDLNGIDATHKIRKEAPAVKILCLSMHSDRRFVLAMFQAGVSGYLLKNCAFKELTHAIHTIAKNQVYISPQIAHILADHARIQQPSTISSILTSREREVLQMVAEGKNTKEIALSLYISVKTVETHRRQIMQKLNINSVAELTKFAIREGLVSLDT